MIRLLIILYLLLFRTTGVYSQNSVQQVNDFISEGYAFVINGSQLASFEYLYLDDDYDHQFIVNIEEKTIYYYTQEDFPSLIFNISELKDILKTDSTSVELIIYNGELYSSDYRQDTYFQYSLLEKHQRLGKEKLDNIGFCRPYKGDWIIINPLK